MQPDHLEQLDFLDRSVLLVHLDLLVVPVQQGQLVQVAIQALREPLGQRVGLVASVRLEPLDSE